MEALGQIEAPRMFGKDLQSHYPMKMKTVILCGGRGTRLGEETVLCPKPLIRVGNEPLLWHLLNLYSQFGFNDFVLALGYRGQLIKEYFLNYQALHSDFAIDLTTGSITYRKKTDCPWRVELVDTGEDTMTGGRLRRLRSYLEDEGTFMLTYGDGIANVNIRELLAFHKRHGKLVTNTVVRPRARFGAVSLDHNRVTRFEEKPKSGEGWINGGFFVMEQGIFEFLRNDETILEQEPLSKLAGIGQMMAFRHEGYWQCMDTLRDKELLDEEFASGNPAWKQWDAREENNDLQ